ncbi:unnamed protein product [Penicillium camemberti]|uniref:Str. FM013 n=1 Tax=Penicillium camemberti (strain FM 013) TaxID=1429867 RepID=A0A0G4P007_PENC3|nr:unnamed protein product [Penicillium camemberti]
MFLFKRSPSMDVRRRPAGFWRKSPGHPADPTSPVPRLYAIGPGLCIFNNSRESKQLRLASLLKQFIFFNVLRFVFSLLNEDEDAILVD